MMKCLFYQLCIILAFAIHLQAADEVASAIEFSTDVLPILQARCESCHGSEEREGGLQFLSRQDLLNRNDSGEPAVIVGKPEVSELIRRVTSDDEFERMPPEGTALTPEQIETLKNWVSEGAKWPEGEKRPVHWAYVPPQRPEVPKVDNSGRVANPIDAFVLQMLSREKPELKQSAIASPAKLLRRVHLDITGLPPAPEQLAAFEKEPTFEHYQRIVDELLASPRYGEKWTRQWLDLARYADSNGFQADQFREIWAYRDWVIQAFNNDMPYDQFTLEQIAGDLLPNATLEQKIATGFQRCTTCNVEAGVDPEENRTNQVIDRVNTAGTVWLGTTLECAQCHNHKYDPFTQEDYYQIFAFFNNTPLEVVQPNGAGVQFEVSGPKMELPLDEQQAEELAKLREQFAAIETKLASRKKELAAVQGAWAQELVQSLNSAPEWHVLTPDSFQSSGGASHDVLEDQSVLLSGKAADKDHYTIQFRTKLDGITGFKLETLTHDSLPGKGPGRGDAERPNFVAYELEVMVADLNEQAATQKVELHSAQADFSQANYPVKGLIDGDSKTGWAINPQFHKPHWASFLTAEPITGEQEKLVTVTIDQHYGGARTIGCLRFSAMTGDPGAQGIPQDVREILASKEKRTAKQKKRLTEYHQSTDKQFAQLLTQTKNLQKKIDAVQPPTTLVMVEMEQPRMTNIFKRGNFLNKGAEVTPDVPAALNFVPTLNDSEGQPDRIAFAEWLVSPENPLVARVAVNRWWSEFFGHGIVDTLEDFGTQGEPPTHPQLLDWLATEFIDNNWSMKHIHRTIVLSETYRQSSSISPEQLEADPSNKWYGRGPRVRMSAEMIRDHALAVSGLLSEKMGGPPIYPPQPANIWRHVGRNAPKYVTDTDEDRFRRGIYVVWRRSAPYPSFVNFDAPDRGACVVKRSRTNTPLQALTLLNDPAYVEMAHALAKRLVTDLPEADTKTRIEYGFRLSLAREAGSNEVETLLNFFENELVRFQNDSKLAEAIIPKAERSDTISIAEQSAWFEVANILLNLDETITKN